jgi:hypothetical protein
MQTIPLSPSAPGASLSDHGGCEPRGSGAPTGCEEPPGRHLGGVHEELALPRPGVPYQEDVDVSPDADVRQFLGDPVEEEIQDGLLDRVEAEDAGGDALHEAAVDPGIRGDLPDRLLVLLGDLQELHLPAAHVHVVRLESEIKDPEGAPPGLLPDQVEDTGDAHPVPGAGDIHDVVLELHVDLAGELARGELLGALLDRDALAIDEDRLLGVELEAPAAAAAGALPGGLQELIRLIQEDGLPALATSKRSLEDEGLNVGGPDDDPRHHDEAPDVLRTDAAEGGLGGESPEPDVHTPNRVGVGGVPDAKLLERGDTELGQVVPGGFQSCAGEVGVEGVEVLEVDGEGFLALHRHLREGLLVLHLVLLVPEALDEAGEGLLGLDEASH